MQGLFGLEGKRIMVVGGGQGMGEATARLLSTLGCNVAIVDLEQERAERVADDIGGSVRAMPFAVDVTDDKALVATIARVERDFGPLDGMATIVGMAAWSPFVDMATETWDLDHRRNLRYFFVAAREVAKSLQARRAPGSMVCIASVDGIVSAPFHASYGAAKAGLINLVKTMAMELAATGIRVNCVAPGGIVTPRLPHGGQQEDAAMAMLPMGRRGTTDEIANAVVFFLSQLASYVTGQTLAVDGGYVATSMFGNKMPANLKPGGTSGIDDLG